MSCPIGLTGRKDREMSRFEGVYSCAHPGIVYVDRRTSFDPEKTAQWRFSGLCPECYKKSMEEERSRKAREAAARSAEMGLPELLGTERQIAWANTLRMKKFDILSSGIERLSGILEERGSGTIPGVDIGIGEIPDAADYFIREHTDAKWWIEHRGEDIDLKEICRSYEEHLDDIANKDVIDLLEKEKGSLTVSPDTDGRKEGYVKIRYKDPVLSAEYIKDNDFMKIVKGLGYRWNGSTWAKSITEYTGSADDRTAELGNRLLLAGFTVQFPDAGSKEMAVSGTYQPENDRWVKYDTKTSQLALVWSKRSDALYNNVKKLPGARWKDGSMKVDIGFYREVEDFAETMGFSVSELAKKKMDEYRKDEESFEKVSVSAAVGADIDDTDRIRRSLRSSGAIIEDLRDE